MTDNFAKPVSGLGVPALGNLDVTASPTGGQGLALDVTGRIPASVHAPYVSHRAMSAGPPSSPRDGDIWIAYNVDGNGTVWQFRYNAPSAIGYRWELFGGSPAYSKVSTSEGTASEYPTTVNLATVGPQFLVPRSGDYQYWFAANANESSANTSSLIRVETDASALIDDDGLAFATSSVASATVQLAGTGYLLSCVAGDFIRMRYARLGGAGTATFGRRQLKVLPVRVL